MKRQWTTSKKLTGQFRNLVA